MDPHKRGAVLHRLTVNFLCCCAKLLHPLILKRCKDKIAFMRIQLLLTKANICYAEYTPIRFDEITFCEKASFLRRMHSESCLG